jgi:hypothetical protein
VPRASKPRLLRLRFRLKISAKDDSPAKHLHKVITVSVPALGNAIAGSACCWPAAANDDDDAAAADNDAAADAAVLLLLLLMCCKQASKVQNAKHQPNSQIEVHCSMTKALPSAVMSVMLWWVWLCALCIAACCRAAAASTAYEQAFKLHQQGDLDAAAVLYHMHLQAEPGSYDAMHMLGLVHYMQAQTISDTASPQRHALAQRAEALVRQAVAAMPRDSYQQALGNLCEILRLQVSSLSSSTI